MENSNQIFDLVCSYLGKPDYKYRKWNVSRGMWPLPGDRVLYLFPETEKYSWYITLETEDDVPSVFEGTQEVMGLLLRV
jgi:hypothetical protein